MATDDELFRTAFAGGALGMAVLDASACLLEVNPTLATWLGHTPQDMAGLMLSHITHPDDLGRDQRLLDRLKRGIAGHIHTQRRLVTRSGEVVWTRTTFSRVPGEPMRIVAQVEDLTEARRAQELLEHRTLHDHLTGLPNRALLLDRATVILDHPAPRAACIFLDIDDFTLVNESWGHEAGDRLLLEISRRLQMASRPGDTVARLGGDEFVVLAPGIDSADAVADYATYLQEAVNRPVAIDGHEVTPSASAGLTLAVPGMSAEALIRDADVAMSSAKRSGRNSAEMFSEDMRRDARMRLSVESELRAALREGQLQVHYQPIVELTTGEIRAYEALVRWLHPQRGLLMPEDFLGVCEEANLVVPLGEVVLRDACRFLADRPGFDGRVLVNVSAQQIGGAGLVEAVRDAITDAGIHSSRLALEITETGMLLATQATRTELDALTELGVELLIDDFGTGYSALSSVLRSPVSGMKLAREFTLRLGDESTGDRISIAISSLVASLKMTGIIEGIETEEQRRLAIAHGWKLAQGYLFAHPKPAAQIPHGLAWDSPSHSLR
ncbi:EAL domain-containing protein [Demequina sp. B12]|uniref:putative bifunctional diguanylate cyclase/phosphodiesterase n=1 Tax=Demequina sp. B12 TaxID=2992757 RepID=UPI00237B6B3A|nr:EAL domain-containing protein [Demequina sp. B12]MDE0572839.1 EAL domain-containing protein [Demequina sp. B12]